MEGSAKKLFLPTLIVGVLAVAVTVSASPAVTSALVHPRIWNDDSDSVLVTGNTYANPPNSGSIFFDDSVLDGDGAGGEWANRHMFRFSDNGITDAVFSNDDLFQFSADVTVTGPANSEAGLEIAPWWSHDVGGGLTVITGNGEIAAFGGRMPFYSFTSNYGITYTKGETVGLSMEYYPPALTPYGKGWVRYGVIDEGTSYSSGWLSFDQANPAEDPPYGVWGILNDARAGGYTLPQIVVGDPTNWSRTDFDNIAYYPTPEPSGLLLLGLGGVALLRRKRS
ncbi:MAG TPA: PEP-CTERM sorting domain-containing protein [Phycisphaerae bacterium]|nr:PEP-CTERM sorting domain-containing protein [Phycisphaerae bacterium]